MLSILTQVDLESEKLEEEKNISNNTKINSRDNSNSNSDIKSDDIKNSSKKSDIKLKMNHFISNKNLTSTIYTNMHAFILPSLFNLPLGILWYK